MITRNRKLTIFESFRVDRGLPKFKPKNKRDQQIDFGNIEGSDEESEDSPPRFNINVTSADGFLISTSGSQSVSIPTPWWGRWRRRLFGPAKKDPTQPSPTVTVSEFFRSVKNNALELHVVQEIANGYERALLMARTNRQTALVEMLTKNLVAIRSEAQLVAIGLTKYIEEETLVEFAEKTERHLRLDWIANFIRMIPEDLIEKKQEADARSVFDNYVVLHYDPKGQNRADTEEERNKKKDPILFGVIDGRRRLYYIGDWVDEFCDLGLDKIAQILGSEAIKDSAVTGIEDLRVQR